MIDNIIKIKNKITKKRDELNNAINDELDKNIIYQHSIELDMLVAEYLKNIKQQEQYEKYKDILNKEFKDEILERIREDVRDKIKDMSDTELEYYCNNIYIYACLKVNNINDNEIIKQLMYRNIIIEEDSEKSKIEAVNLPIEFNNYIVNKYCKIIKCKL